MLQDIYKRTELEIGVHKYIIRDRISGKILLGANTLKIGNWSILTFTGRLCQLESKLSLLLS